MNGVAPLEHSRAQRAAGQASEARRPAMKRAWSLRRYLLAWIVAPIVAFVAFDTVGLYRSALASINVAYDRALLTSARSIADLLSLRNGELQLQLPHNALEILDDEDTRMYWRITGFHGEHLSGYEDFPPYTRKPPQRSDYAALVDFYDAEFRGEPVRMAALYQPVASAEARGVALVQVAETLEVRRRLARQMLFQTLQRQALLIAVVVGVTWIVVARALKPVDTLRRELTARSDRDLSPVADPGLPMELSPFAAAVNELMQRLSRLLEHQKRFVRDASHQLRTPLAVMKTQVQAALRGPGDVPRSTVQEMHTTVDRAIRLANQMLALAKLEQVHGQGERSLVDVAEVAREVALDLSPLIGEKRIEFEIDAEPAQVLGHEWMLRELTRNLLANAIRATPSGGELKLLVRPDSNAVELLVRDTGPGLDEAHRAHLFEPFMTGHPTEGSGLGLAICREVCESFGATIELLNREHDGRVIGLDVRVRFPAARAAQDGDEA